MTVDDELNPRAREELDRYLVRRERRIEEALKDVDDLTGKRWSKLVFLNLALIATGAVGVVRVAASAAESAAIDTVTASRGIVSTLVTEQVRSINERMGQASVLLGKVGAVTEDLKSKVDGVNTKLESEFAIATQSIFDTRSAIDSEADRQLRELMSAIDTQQTEFRSSLEKKTQELLTHLESQTQAIDALSERGTALRQLIAEFEALTGDDLDAKIDRLTRISRELFEGEDSVTKLDRLVHLESQTASLQSLMVPVGGVIGWWGAFKDIPSGFELCDGKPPAPGSTLKGAKPDLMGRYPRGADPADRVREELTLGGDDVLKGLMTEGVKLTVAQMPSHNHEVLDPGHAHGIADPGHSHRVPMGDGDSGERDKAADGDRQERRRVETASARTGIQVSSAKTGAAVLSNGGGEAHAHAIPELHIRPSFQELFYIIRVR